MAAWLSVNDPAALGPTLNNWMRYVGLVAVMLLGMHLALSVHGSVVREREQGTEVRIELPFDAPTA